MKLHTPSAIIAIRDLFLDSVTEVVDEAKLLLCIN